MTTRTEAQAEKSFVNALLPWITAGVLAVVYLATFNHWISLKTLPEVARATGQTYGPETNSPLFNLVTSPLQWLPETTLPVVMNLFSVVCAFFVLVLLARSVALLPHDRTQRQREREQSPFAFLSLPTAWVPPVLAVIVCGLQLTFWENATVLSRGMFDLLLFAYAVRCLLEYRVDGRESWLLRAAVVYAAGVTETWVMAGLLPVLLAAMIWVKGLSFFQLRFLSRLFLCLAAGLLFYFYLPLLHLRSNGFFWAPLKDNLAAEFFQIEYILRYTPHHVQFLLILTSLLPMLVIGIRWKSSFGDTSELGIALTTWIFHLTHAALLAVCIWAAFDTGFGLRDSEGRFPILAANRDNLLPFYYIAALGIGYFSGYFLLVFRPLIRRGRRPSGPDKALNSISTAVVFALLVLVPAGLLFKNAPEIKITNGPALQQYATCLTENLPPRAVVLADGGVQLLLAQEWLARTGKATNYIFLDTQVLRYPLYHQVQAKKHPGFWPESTNTVDNQRVLGDIELINLLVDFKAKTPLYYLHPSFGYYFETFYAVPHGIIYELKQYSTNTQVEVPPLGDKDFADNENFWKQNFSSIQTLLPAITPPKPQEHPPFRQRWMTEMHIPFEPNRLAVQLGSIYSRALNVWGVQAQRMGRLEAAGKHFADAQDLSVDNVIAAANFEFNRKLRAGERVKVEDPTAFEDRFGKYNTWQRTLEICGPFDDATGCLAQGIVFERGHLSREAAQEFLRVLELAPDSLLARLWLARVYLGSRTPEKAEPLIDELKARSSGFADAAIIPSDMVRLEIQSDYANKRYDHLRNFLRTIAAQKPPDKTLIEAAAQMSVAFGAFSNAVPLINKLAEISPNDPMPFVSQGFLAIQMNQFSNAITPLSRAISLQPTNTPALLYRAVAYLRSDKLDESQRDYETLAKLNPAAYPAYYGLAEVATRKKDTNAAIQYYQICLTNMVPNSPEQKFIADRIKNLKTGSP